MSEKIKRPSTLTAWQKIYPDAMRVTGTSKILLSSKDILKLARCEEGKGKVLQNSSCGSWTSKGMKVVINAIVSPNAIKADI